MAALPWKRLASVDPSSDDVMYASMLPLSSVRATPAFLRLIPRIRRQMRLAPGAEIRVPFREGSARLDDWPRWRPEQALQGSAEQS